MRLTAGNKQELKALPAISSGFLRKNFRTGVMGILNVTPDSFFDGGAHDGLAAALKCAESMIEDGADIIDVGGESSRPGSQPVPLKEELRRVLPVIAKLKKKFPKIPVSIDTQKSGVARACIESGADIVNDISALRADAEMARVAADTGVSVILMHMKGTPQTMQNRPVYKNVVHEVRRFLDERVRWCVEQGISPEKISVDPGIGFGKSVEHNLELLKQLPDLARSGCPVVVGCSRKWFIGKALSRFDEPLPAEERLEGSLAAACWCAMQGASVVRVHDVRATRRALDLLSAIRSK